MSAKLYQAPQMPLHWIAEDEGRLVFWPALGDGWEQRKPYRGHKRALVECDPLMATGTGWPGTRGGTRPGSGRPAQYDEPTTSIRISESAAALIKAIAEERGTSVRVVVDGMTRETEP